MESNDAPPNAKTSLRLLSIDGEWIAGFPQLFVVKEIMKAINPQVPPKPCDVFDLICGTSSGGLIAIMLGRMRMTVEQAIVSTMKLESSDFVRSSGRWRFDTRGKLGCLNNSADLSRDLQKIITHHGMRADESLREPTQHSPITLVTAQRIDNNSLELFSSDPFQERNPSEEMTILEAARITSTTSTYFAPVVVGPSHTGYMSGELLAKNPINETLQWAKQKWPQATISCLASISAGNLYKAGFPKSPGTPPSYWVPVARDPEQAAGFFLLENREMALANSYFRFTLPISETIDLNKINAMNQLPVVDKVWQKHPIFPTIKRCAERLRHPSGPSPRNETTRKEVNMPGAVDQQAESAAERNFAIPMTLLQTAELVAEAIARDLSDDADMCFLLLAATGKIAEVRLKRNLAILLEDFAQRLTTVPNLESVAHFVGSRKLDIVDRILRRERTMRGLPRETQFTTAASLPSYEDVMLASDEIRDLVETQREFRIPDPEDVKTSLSKLDRPILLHSLSFTEMKEDLRRFVFPSMKSYIREIILPLLPATNRFPIYSVAVRVLWELEEYLFEGFDANVDIDDIATLTGEVAYAQALPCGEYMQQSWPRTGADTLTAVKYALKRGNSHHQYSSTHSIKLEFEESEATASEEGVAANGRVLLVQISGRPMELVETIEQFAWFASAFRSVGENKTGLSQVDLRVVSESSESQGLMTELILLPLRTCTHTEPIYGSCWLSLISASALAWGFPIKDRGEAVGLEMPFQLMFKACGVRYPIEFQDSIIIRQGPLTIYPVAKHHDGVQWHVVDGGLDAFFEILKAIPILSPEGDVHLFSKTRTFVGWLTHACVRLGTIRPTDEASGAETDDERGRMLADEVTMSLSVKVPVLDLVSASVGMKMRFPKNPTQRVEVAQLGYEVAIARSSRTPAIYYDCKDKTGWLVPELNLLLHVAYAALLDHRPALEALHRIPYAKQCGNGPENAIAVIKESESIVLWKSGADKKEFRFKDHIAHFLNIFDHRKEAMRVTLEQHQFNSDLGLRGWDFMDIRDNIAFSNCRLIPPPRLTNMPQWWTLAKNPNVPVVFGSKLAQVIVPDRSLAEVCRYWAEIPAEHNLLVGSVRCVKDICRPFQVKLPKMHFTNDLAWHQPKDSHPFDVCTGNGCNPVQKLRNVNDYFHGYTPPARVADDGAVIFGRPEDVKKYISSKIYPCAPLPVQDGSSQDRIYLAPKARPDPYALVVLNWFGHMIEALDSRSIIPWAVLILCMAKVIGWAFKTNLGWRITMRTAVCQSYLWFLLDCECTGLVPYQ